MTRPVVHLPEGLRREIVDHCLAGRPNEACGLFAMQGLDVVRVYPTSNDDASPVSFTVPPEEHFAALTDAESNGWELAGSFHSHPEGPAVPSSVDVEGALEPEWVYLIVGMREEIDLRAWSIANGTTREITIGGDEPL